MSPEIRSIQIYFWKKGFDFTTLSDGNYRITKKNRSVSISTEFIEYLFKLRYTDFQIFDYYRDKIETETYE